MSCKQEKPKISLVLIIFIIAYEIILGIIFPAWLYYKLFKFKPFCEMTFEKFANIIFVDKILGVIFGVTGSIITSLTISLLYAITCVLYR